MGAPCWSLEEREYFVQVILPMSKYAGGTYSKPEGLAWDELAAIMQEELDRKGVSRRKYTSDMLFQHYYQKCSTRSYKRGEGDSMVVPGAVSAASPGNMNPPPRPAARRRPATKKPSNRITYSTKATQTRSSIEAGSEAERSLQKYTQFSGPLVDSPVTDSNFEVRSTSTSSRKRKLQATVENANDDDEECGIPLKEEFMDEELVMQKGKTARASANSSEARSRGGQGMLNDYGDISQATQFLRTQSPEPERTRLTMTQNPWAKPPGAQSRIPVGGSGSFGSPDPDAHSVGTSSIAYKQHTQTPSLEVPPSVSDTGYPLKTSRVSHFRALMEERSRPVSRASNRSESSYGDFHAVPSPLRESSRNSSGEELDIRGPSENVHPLGVGPSRGTHGYYGDFPAEDFIRSPRRQPSRFETYGEVSQSHRFSRPPQHEASRFGGYREVSEAPTIPRTTRMSSSGYQGGYADDFYPANRPASPFGPTRYYGSRIGEEHAYHDGELIRQNQGRSFRFSTPSEPRNGEGNIENPTTTQRPATSSCSPLSGFRIRKRSQVQPPTHFKKPKRISQVSESTEEPADGVEQTHF